MSAFFFSWELLSLALACWHAHSIVITTSGTQALDKYHLKKKNREIQVCKEILYNITITYVYTRCLIHGMALSESFVHRLHKSLDLKQSQGRVLQQGWQKYRLEFFISVRWSPTTDQRWSCDGGSNDESVVHTLFVDEATSLRTQ